MVTDNGKFIAQEPNPEHPTGKSQCIKGKAAPELVYNSQRLLYPVMRTRPKGDPDPGWKRVSWDEALDHTAKAIDRIRKESGAESVAFSIATPSGTPIGDDIRWIERFANVFGSPNIVNGTEICNWHKDFTHTYTFGRGIGTPDFENTNCIVLWGHNPGATWLNHAAQTSAAKSRGARIVVVDPRQIGFAVEADQWLRVRPGADGALALGISRAMIVNGWFDKAFVRDWTNGPLLVRTDTMRFVRAGELANPPAGSCPDDLVARDEMMSLAAYSKSTRCYNINTDQLMLSTEMELPLVNGENVKCKSAFKLYSEVCDEFTPERVEQICWVTASQVAETARLLFESGPVSYYCWSGVAQHTNATQTDRAIATLMALTGSFDAKGGNIEFGKLPINDVTGGQFLTPEQRAKCIGLEHLPLGPAKYALVGSDVLYRAMLDKKPYAIRGMLGFGRNFLLNHADADRGAEALSKLKFYAHMDVSLTPTASFADIVFPINTPWERQALRTGFEGSEAAEQLVQLRQAAIPSLGESHSDAFVVFELAKRLGLGDKFWDGDVDAGLEHILKPLNICLDDLRKQPNGISFPTVTHYQKYLTQGCKTDTGKIELFSEVFRNKGQDPLPRFVEPAVSPFGMADDKFPLVLTTSKVPSFRHSQDRQIPSLRQRNPDPEINLHPDTAEERGIQEGDWLYVRTPHNEIRMRAKYDGTLDPRVVWAQYGWWQNNEELGLQGFDALSDKGSNFSRLISDELTDPVSGSSALRSYVCDIQPITTRANKAWYGWRPFKITSSVHEAEDIMSFRLSPVDGQPLPTFMSGQYITIRTGPDGAPVWTRCYSLSSYPESGSYRITVKLSKAADGTLGYMSSFLHSIRDSSNFNVELLAPSGDFHLGPALENDPSPICLIAGGIGITPLLSMLHQIKHTNWSHPVQLYYGVRSSADHAFAGEISALRKAIPRLKVTTFYSQPSDLDRINDRFDYEGIISVEKIDNLDAVANMKFYLCGPQGMIASLTTSLIQRGIPEERIFLEAFGPSSKQNPITHNGPQPITLARSGKSFIWNPDAHSLLELVELNGNKVNSGCRVGQCECCSVKLLDGKVTYPTRNNLKDTGSCLLCTAVPLTPLIIDI